MKRLFMAFGLGLVIAGCATESDYAGSRARRHSDGLAGYESLYDGVPGRSMPSSSPRGTWREPGRPQP